MKATIKLKRKDLKHFGTNWKVVRINWWWIIPIKQEVVFESPRINDCWKFIKENSF